MDLRESGIEVVEYRGFGLSDVRTLAFCCWRPFEASWKYDYAIFIIRSPANLLYPLTGMRSFTVAACSPFINFCHKPPLTGLCLTCRLIDLIYITLDLTLVPALIPGR